MKSFFSFLLVICLLSPALVLAEGGCSVETSPSDGLIAYRKNIDTLLQHISTQAGKWSCQGGSQSQRALSQIDASWNKGFSLSTVIMDFRYNTELVERWEPKTPIKRDEALLQWIEKKIDQSMTTLGIQCALDVPVDVTLFQGIEGSPVSGSTLEEVMDSIIQNHKKIEKLYKYPTFWENLGDLSIALVPSSFTTDVTTSYNPMVVANCTPESGQKNWGEVRARFLSLISWRSQKTREGIQAWKDAIALFQNNKGKTTDLALERKLLSQELARQGVSNKWADIILANLDAYNTAGSRSNDEESGNRFTRALANLSTQITQDSDHVLSESLKESKNTDEWIKRYQNLKSRPKAIIKMAEEYRTARELLGDESALDAKMINDLVDLHIKLSQANDDLRKVGPRASAVCDRQLPWYGNCRDYQ